MAQPANSQIYIDLQVRADNAQKKLAELLRDVTELKEAQRLLTNQQKQLAKESAALSSQMAAATKTYDDQITALKEQVQAGKISIADYQQQEAALNALRQQAMQPYLQQLQDLDARSRENADSLASVTAQLKPLSAELSKTTKETEHIAKAQEDSLNGMRAQLNLLLRDYDRLTEEEKQTAAGEELLKHINDLTDAVTEQEEATGRYQRNVGNYVGAIKETLGGTIATIAGLPSLIASIANGLKNAPQTINNISIAIQQSTQVAMTSITSVANNITTILNAALTNTITVVKNVATVIKSTFITVLQNLPSIFATVTKAIGTATKAALKFIATPIGAVIAAVAAVVLLLKKGFDQLKEAIGRSDDAGTAFASLMARFQVIGKAVGQVFNWLVKQITPAIETISKFIGKVINLIPGLKEINEAQEAAIRIEDELQDRRREATKAEGERAKRLAELEIIYNDSTKSAKEREEALLQTIEVEKQAAREQLEMAKLELQMKREQLKVSQDTSDAAKDELAALEAAVAKAEAGITQATASATRKLSSFRNQQASEAKAAAEKRRKAIEDAEKAITALVETNAKARIETINDEYLKTEVVAKAAYDKERAELEQQLAAAEAVRKQYGNRQRSEEYKNAVRTIDEITAALEAKQAAYYKAIEALAERHQQTLRTLEKTNEELRIAAIDDEKERTQAAYELRLRGLDEERQAAVKVLQQTHDDLAAALNDGLITREQYDQRAEQIEAEFAAKIENIDLRTAAERKARTKALYEENLKTITAGLAAVNSEYEKALKDADKFDFEAKTKALEAREEAIKQMYDSLSSMSEADAVKQYGSLEAWKTKVGELSEAYKQAGKDVKENSEQMAAASVEQLTKATEATKSLTGTISGYYQEKYNEIINSNEELTESQKQEALDYAESQYAATMAGIVLDQAKGIANTFVGGTKALAEVPYPANIVAMASVIASGLASIVSGISQAKQATAAFEEQKSKIAGMATGGLVQGPGTAKSDSIPAFLSNGESVMTARATAAHYDTLSRWNVEGGGRPFPNSDTRRPYRFASGGVAMDYTALGATLQKAMKEVSPVVSVEEINRVNNRVAVKETDQ